MCKLTQKEMDAFDGLEESYVNMYRELEKIAPTCHFTKMIYESGEIGEGNWWECVHCGHTKDA